MKVRKEKELPISNARVFKPGTVAVFEINSLDFLDPYSLFLAFTVKNLSNTFIQLDSSAHSIIQKIVVKYKKTGELLEQIEDYDMLMSLTHNLTLTQKDRAGGLRGQRVRVEGDGAAPGGVRVHERGEGGGPEPAGAKEQQPPARYRHK